MFVESLWQAVPPLQAALQNHPLVTDREQLWQMLRQLAVVPAPTTGVMLPGAIFDEVTDIAAVFGLADRFDARLTTGGMGSFWLGVNKERVDLVVSVPLDQPSFRPTRLEDAHSAEIMPAGRLRIPSGFDPLPARAIRYDSGRGTLRVTAQGVITSTTLDDGQARLRFQAERGRLSYSDTVTLDTPLFRQHDLARGTGVGNCASILMALGAAAVLRQIEEALLERDRRCVFVFWDRQGGWPYAYSTRGALSRSTPALGTVVIDGHLVQPGGIHLDAGVACAMHAAELSRMLVPINYQQLTMDFLEALNQVRPGSAQLDASYLPGLEDNSWQSRVLGLIGPPVTDSFMEPEQVSLRDIESGVIWLSLYLVSVLNLVSDLTVHYSLDR